MSSHNSAIASRTSCGEFTVTIHRYITVGRLCCTRSLILNNANQSGLCMIILDQSEVGSVSQSLFFFAFCIKGFTCRISAAFPCSLLLMLYLPIDFLRVVVCLSLLYMIARNRSIGKWIFAYAYAIKNYALRNCI
jgi:hypothetical protein